MYALFPARGLTKEMNALGIITGANPALLYCDFYSWGCLLQKSHKLPQRFVVAERGWFVREQRTFVSVHSEAWRSCMARPGHCALGPGHRMYFSVIFTVIAAIIIVVILYKFVVHLNTAKTEVRYKCYRGKYGWSFCLKTVGASQCCCPWSWLVLEDNFWVLGLDGQVLGLALRAKSLTLALRVKPC